LQLIEVNSLVGEDLIKVEESIRSVSKVGYPWLAEMLGHTIAGGGKRVRPALCLLCGKLYEYDFKRLVLMATSVELLHTATLVHDDAIDKSPVRRGRSTVNQLWGEEKAVLLGDYLFAKAGEFSASTENIRVVKLFAQTLEIISKGELNQAFNAFNLKQNHEDYIQRIADKTASLFVLSTESGAVLSHAPEKSVQALKEYGYNLGVAFQIVDDILDFTSTEKELGKPIGSDLAQGTFTLPAMLLVEHYPGDNPVKRLFESRGERKENIGRAIETVRNSTIVEECYKFATAFSVKACSQLDSLPDCPARQALKELAEYVVSRQS